MAEYCTCGAQLPPDARFCHKCGKPQREEPALEQDEPAPPPQPVVAQAPPPPVLSEISFHNLVAVRVGFLSAAIAAMLIYLPLPMLLRLMWILAAGFLSVWLYRRRTGSFLSVRNGARIGVITGVLCFVIITVLFTVNYLAMTLSGETGGLVSMLREQLQQRGFPKEMIDIAMSPAAIALGILFSLAFYFVGFLGIGALGGALGARVLSKD